MITERERLLWRAQGLPADTGSLVGASCALRGPLVPIFIDPSGVAVSWLKNNVGSRMGVEQIDSSRSRLTPQPRESLEKSLHPEGAHRHVASANDRCSFTLCHVRVHVCSCGRSSLRMCEGTRQTREEKAKRSEHERPEAERRVREERLTSASMSTMCSNYLGRHAPL